MDGTYVIGYQGDVKINYINKLTGQTISDSVIKTDEVDKTISVTNEDIKTINGYTYDSRDKDSCKVERNTTGEINLYYVPKDKISMTIQGKTDTKEYDGTEQTNSLTPNVTIGGTEYSTTLVKGNLKFAYENKDYCIRGYTLGSGTNYEEVGYSDSYKDIKILNGEDTDVTNAFNISQVNPGKLNITKRTITIKADDQTKQYTGKEVQADKDKYNEVVGEDKSSKLVKGDSISASVKGLGTDVNDSGYPIDFDKDSVKITNSLNKDVTKNYNINKKEGKLYIVSKSVTDSTLKVAKPSDVKYNGENQELEPEVVDSVTGKPLEKDKDYTLSYSDNTKDVGTVTVTITGKGNYKDTVDTTYEIKKAPLTISASNAEKEYDGKPLTSSTTTITGLKGTDTISASASGSITDIGNTANVVDADSVNWSGADAKNYDVKYVNGTLKVTPKSITSDIQIDIPKDVDYNGNSQQQPPRITDKEGHELVEGKDYDISYSEDTTNVGTVTVKITGKGNYKDSNSYTYKIKPIDLEIKVSDLNSKYTGNTITPNSNGYQISGKLANGDEIFITLGGGKKNPGTYKNELYVKNIVIRRNGVDVTKNYNVKTIPGTLTISSVSKKPNTGVENKTGFFTSMFVASGAVILALLESKKRK